MDDPPALDPHAFATALAQAHQDIYLHAVRRVRDKREQLTRETAAFLLHLAEAGPMTLTDSAATSTARRRP